MHECIVLRLRHANKKLQCGQNNRYARCAAGLDAEEGTPADEADVELKSNASESSIWRLTAGKGEMGVEGAGPLGKSGSLGSGDYSGGVKAREPTSERMTAAGRIDFVLQVRGHVIVVTLMHVHLLRMSVGDKTQH